MRVFYIFVFDYCIACVHAHVFLLLLTYVLLLCMLCTLYCAEVSALLSLY